MDTRKQVVKMAEPETDFRSKLFECYRNKTLCDVVLVAVADGTRIEAHRLVLFVASEFFDILLTIPMKEREMHEIRLQEIDGATLRSLVEYCYTGRIDITAANVNEVVAATTMYRFTELRQNCSNVYAKILNAANCMSICTIADKYSLVKLLEEATNYTNKYFVDVMKNAEFLELKYAELLQFVKSEEIVVNAEEEILNGITKWVQFDVVARKTFYKDLISNVKLLDLEKNSLAIYMGNLGEENIDLMSNFWFVYKLKMNGEPISNIKRKSPSPNMLFAIGGNDSVNLSIERYCPKLNTWTVAETSFINRSIFATVTNDNTHHVYLIGGYQNRSYSNEVYCLSMESMEFTQMKSMTHKRNKLVAVVLHGYIYAIGGEFGTTTNIVERFDSKSNEWKTMAPMLQSRRFPAAAVLSGKIFVVGGLNNSDILGLSECYDPDEDAWTPMGSLNAKRSNHGCCVVNDVLYTVGGFDGNYRLDSIERYDQQINKWTLIEIRLEVPRSSFGMAVHGVWAYIAGGFITRDNEVDESNEFEKINLETGERTKLAAMQHRRSFFHLCSGLKSTSAPLN